MKVTNTNKAIFKSLVNYGEVAYRRNDIDLDVILDGSDSVFGGSGNDDKPLDKDEDVIPNTSVTKTPAPDVADTSVDKGVDKDITDFEKMTEVEVRTHLLDKYKGSDFNDNGDIIDENDEIVTPVDEIKEYQTNDESTVVSEVVANLGYDLTDESGQPVVYEDTVEGITSLVSDTSNVIVEEKINEFLNAFPEVNQLYNHLATGGDVTNFFSDNSNDWSKVELERTNKEQLRSIIKEDYKNKNIDDTTIDNVLTSLEDSGKLFDTAKTSKDAIIKNKEAVKAQKERDIIAKEKERSTKIIEHWKEIETIVKNGKLKNVSIPKSDVDTFYAYVSKSVDNNGNSQNAIDRKSEDKETNLMMAYFRFKGYSLDKMAKVMAKQERVDNLRSRISKNNIKSIPTRIKGKAKSADTVNISIDNLY